jgi:glycosyltransferase involved in cell wall biosynthesis
MSDRAPLPRVVACMPAWNAAAFIEPVLASLAAQTYPALSVLISVDVCNDGTAEICEAFADRHPNARVVRQTERLGWVGNSNALLRMADGVFLFFAFHDDPLHPEYVARLVEALERSPEAGLAFSDVESNLGPYSYDLLDGVDDAYERAYRILCGGGPWWVPNRGLIRTSVARAAGGLRRHRAGEFSADWPWLLRLAMLGAFVRVSEPLLVKHFRPTGLSTSWDYGLWRRVAVQFDLLQVIRSSTLSPGQKLRLHVALGAKWLRTRTNRVVGFPARRT